MSHIFPTIRRAGLTVTLAALVLGVLAAPSSAAYRFAVPKDLKPTSTTDTSVTLSWTAVSGASSYRVQYATKSNMSGAAYARFTTAGGTIKDLKKNTTYYVRVAAIDPRSGAKLSDYTQTPYPTVTTGTVLAGGYSTPVPQNLKSSSITTTSAKLSWGAVSGAKAYRVQLSTAASMAGATYHRFTSTSGTIKDLVPGTPYWARVAVIDSKSGAKLSDYTQTPYAELRTEPVDDGYTFPIPTALTATDVSPTTAKLTWDAVPGAQKYRVQVSSNASMSSAKYHEFTSAGGTITGLSRATVHYVRVAVVDPDTGVKRSDYTQKPYVELRTPASDDGYSFLIPSELEVADSSTTSLDLTWKAEPGARRYRVQISPNASMSGATYDRFNSNKGTIEGLQKDTTYYVRVAVIDPDTNAKLSDYTAKPYLEARTRVTDSGVDLVFGSYNVSGVQNDTNANLGSGGEMGRWVDRRGGVIDAIIGSKAAVVGLQEANQSRVYNEKDGRDATPYGDNQFLDLLAGLKSKTSTWDIVNKYYYNCAKHTSSISCVNQDRGASQATRIAYDSAKVSLEDSGSVKYSAQSAGTTERYLAWAVFRTKSNGQEFFFATTHLDPYNQTVRANQWKQVATEVDRRAGGLPAVVTGDFNGSKYSDPAAVGLPAMSAIGVSDVLGQEPGINPPRKIRAEKVTLGFLNSFNDYVRDLANDNKCYCTSQDKIGNGIDYVFATNALRVKTFALNAKVDSAFRLVGTIPSDHHMLTSTIVMD